MRFVCERCGKRYTAPDALAPGKIYKLACKACGHLIVLRGAAGSAIALAAEPVPADGASAGAPQALGGATIEVVATPSTPPGAREVEPRPAPGDGGFVDLFSDLAFPEEGPEQGAAKPGDPLLAVARASLPETYGGAPAPFPPLAPGPAGAQAARPPAPQIPRPPPWKGTLPIALIAAGMAILVGILALVLLGPGKTGLPAPPPPPAQARAPLAQPAPGPATR